MRKCHTKTWLPTTRLCLSLRSPVCPWKIRFCFLRYPISSSILKRNKNSSCAQSVGQDGHLNRALSHIQQPCHHLDPAEMQPDISAVGHPNNVWLGCNLLPLNPERSIENKKDGLTYAILMACGKHGAWRTWRRADRAYNRFTITKLHDMSKEGYLGCRVPSCRVRLYYTNMSDGGCLWTPRT